MSKLLQQKEVYDRRTTTDKLQEALRLTASHTHSFVVDKEEEAGEGKEDTTCTPTPILNDVVAVVEETSTRLEPKFMLEKILRVMKKEILLAWLKPTKKAAKTGYSMVVGTDTWIESTAALIYPIDVEWDESSRMYLLHSDPVQIHKALNSSGP